MGLGLHESRATAHRQSSASHPTGYASFGADGGYFVQHGETLETRMPLQHDLATEKLDKEDM